jgi:transcriptional regulator
VYLPRHFTEARAQVLHRLIEAHPLGTLVTLGPDGPEANHLPFEISPEPAPFGTLRGHVARANPVWRTAVSGAPALVMFHGPAAYVSPSFYPSKRVDPRVVPTWNYVVVHAHGSLRAVEEPEWLRALVERLTRRHEASRRDPWHVTDAPEDFVAGMLGAIVGLELPIAKLVGKWKLSQNRSDADRRAVEAGLRREGGAAGEALAAWMRDAMPGREPPC